MEYHTKNSRKHGRLNEWVYPDTLIKPHKNDSKGMKNSKYPQGQRELGTRGYYNNGKRSTKLWKMVSWQTSFNWLWKTKC